MNAVIASDLDVPPFTSTESAVRFAVTREGVAARPIITKMMALGTVQLAGRGWSMLESAAQAGLILGALRLKLSRLGIAMLVAKAAPSILPCGCRAACCSGKKINFTWRNAIEEIAYEGREICPLDVALRTAILIKIYGRQYTHLVQISKEFNQDIDAVALHHRQLFRWLYGSKSRGKEGLENQAWREADAVLRSVGIVGEG